MWSIAAGMLYTHALESIFGFASLKDLTALLAVCQRWKSAGLSMAPICARPPSNPSSTFGSLADCIARVCASPLRRHVTYLRNLIQ